MPETKPLKINFSHNYEKLYGIQSGFTAMLFNVSRVNLEELPKEFLEWDTRYWKNGEPEHYELPKKGDYLLLLFGHKKGEQREGMGIYTLFQTIRRWRKNKEEYYRAQVGKTFEVVIER